MVPPRPTQRARARSHPRGRTPRANRREHRHTHARTHTHTHTIFAAPIAERKARARDAKKTPRMIYWPLVALINVVSRVPILKRGVKTKHCFEAAFPPRPVGAFGWKVVMLWSRSACAETKRAHSDPIRYHR